MPVIGPRIYNLFPLLSGKVSDWSAHLPRIAAMDFNWIFVNPFHYPGFSGSLYAVKDYHRLHPLLQGDSSESAETLLRKFVDDAERHGLGVIMDLVINHTAKDAELVSTHPDWYVREANGEIKSPSAIDPADANQVTVWGDLAELDYAAKSGELAQYWARLAADYAGLGIRGFRCDAAYKIPGAVWGTVIDATRAAVPEAQFFAETLGARLPETEQLKSAGFDYFFNSAKWWDFREPWLLEQYEMFRKIAPSIAFPDSHDTTRLAADTDADPRESALRYLFAACFSSGVMITQGYEFGFRKKLDVVRTRPDDWEMPSFDLTAFIRDVNAMKSRVPVLNEEGPQQRVTPPDSPVTALLRRGRKTPGRTLSLINTLGGSSHPFGVDAISGVLGAARDSIEEITPGQAPLTFRNSSEVSIPARAMRIFHRQE
ncbi:MAG: alpha-amylase [Burkholderiales bacterium]|nr:alpha-amylase [Burkholderiales bacterium]